MSTFYEENVHQFCLHSSVCLISMLICVRTIIFQGTDASHVNEAMDLAAKFASMKLT